MKLEDIGEHALIRQIANRFNKKLPPELLCGIGDDCAVIDRGSDTLELVTIDSQIEGVHFLKNAASPQDVGYKSLAVNLSDIAAMGGRPSFAFLSMAFPKDLDANWIDRFFDGFQKLADLHNVLLAGGNTSQSPGPICIDVCLIGKVQPDCLKLRSGAKQGDIICVTGTLGNSMAGLKIIRQFPGGNTLPFASLAEAFRRPRPHVNEGIWLGGIPQVHAMLDVSDGLASDLSRLKEQSNAGFAIDLDLLPISDDLQAASLEYGWDSIQIAFSGGEEYCLLFTVDPLKFTELKLQFEKTFNRQLYKIGEVVSPDKDIACHIDGKLIAFPGTGFDHFLKADE